jgi:hypothetical protein
VAGPGDEVVKILEHNQEQLYEIVEMDDGTVVLEIVLAAPAAAFAMYVMRVPFTAEKVTRHLEEGRSTGSRTR